MAPSAQVVYNAVLRNDGEVRGNDVYAGRAGVALAFLRTAEVLRRGKLRLQASKDGDAHDDAATVRRISRVWLLGNTCVQGRSCRSRLCVSGIVEATATKRRSCKLLQPGGLGQS